MSHYITAEIDQVAIELTGGSSHTTILATAYSGFDIYGIFNALMFNGGMSGTGGVVETDFKVAENAYKNAIAWAKALELSFPEKYNSEFNELMEYRKDFPNYITNHGFSEEELNGLVKEKREYHHELNEDQIKSSIYLLYGILYFTHHVYEYTKKGNIVEIGFC